jgi:Na+-driven multidrug efflux pump
VGVGWGTFAAKLTAALAYVIIFLLPSWGELSLSIPSGGWNLVITRQLLKVSLPRSLQGGYQSLIAFPFNSLVLLFGTEAAAAYHIARRIQQQLMAPLQRAYGTVTTILAGQKLGEDLPEESIKVTEGILWLTLTTVGLIGGGVFLFAPRLVSIFSNDAATINYGIQFLQALGLAAPILGCYLVFSSLLTAAGDTRTSFYGLVVSQTLFKLGLSYILVVWIGFELPGIFIGLIISYLVQAGWVARRFWSRQWIGEAQEMIAERHS